MLKKILVLLGVTAGAASVGAVCYAKRASKKGLTVNELVDKDTDALKEKTKLKREVLYITIGEFKRDMAKANELLADEIQSSLSELEAAIKVD